MGIALKGINVWSYLGRATSFGVVVFFLVLFVPKIQETKAADCGGAVLCSCGDTVTSNYTLTADLICTGDGLIIGADGITLDGAGFSISGDRGTSDIGISAEGRSNVIIQNFGDIKTFFSGISFNAATNNSTIRDNKISSSEVGISLGSSTENSISENNVDLNSVGISLNSSYSNTLIGNILYDNTSESLSVYGSNTSDFNNDIDTTNKVEGKSIYYLYNVDGTAENPLIYDGSLLGDDIGMFWCISCSYIQVKNANLSIHNRSGVYFNDTTYSNVENVSSISNGYYGIQLVSSSNNTLGGNTVNSNGTDGIYLSDSSSNSVSNNTSNLNVNSGIEVTSSSFNDITSNTVSLNGQYGIFLSSSSSNNLVENTVSKNKQGYFDDGTNTYSLNRFIHNANNKMLVFEDTDSRMISTGGSIYFDLTSFSADGTACNSCSSAVSYPSETIIQDSEVANNVTGHFVANRAGIYSLIFSVTDSDQNTTQRNILFFVGTTASKTTRFYYRGINPTHGQPGNNDARSLLSVAPTESEIWNCSDWVQNSIDTIPDYPLANLSTIDTYSWYKQSAVNGAYIGAERYFTYGMEADVSSGVDASMSYKWANKKFTGLNWPIDYMQNWYRLTLKVRGTRPYQTTFPTSFFETNRTDWASHHHEDGTTDASYVDFTYSYTTTPAIKSVSNEDLMILSATAPTADSTDYSIVVSNPTAVDATTDIELGSQTKPFSGVDSTTISSDGTATISVAVLANSTSTVDVSPYNLLVTPSTGSVTVDIDAWNTSGDYSKSWSEDGSTHDITTEHTIGDMKPSTSYALSIDGVFSNYYFSSSSGEITFNYTGGYSSHTFELTEATSDVSPSATPTSSTISSIEVLPETGVDKYLFWAMGLI